MTNVAIGNPKSPAVIENGGESQRLDTTTAQPAPAGAAQPAPAGAAQQAERPVQRMEGWSDTQYIAELENVVRLLRRDLEKLHRVREALADCSAGQPCSTCPDKKKCQRGCIRQEEFISTEYHARQRSLASRWQAPAQAAPAVVAVPTFEDFCKRHGLDPKKMDGHGGMWARVALDECRATAQPAPPTTQAWPIAADVSADLERSDWTPEEALRWYAAGKHYDTVPNGDGTSSARILDNGEVASNALRAYEQPSSTDADPGRLLAEHVLGMDFVTDRGLRARELARKALVHQPAVQQGDAEVLLIAAVDEWFAKNTGLGGCSDKDVQELQAIFAARSQAKEEA